MERKQLLIPDPLESRFVILYGKGVDDTYLTDQFEECDLPFILHHVLKQRGFGKIIFHSPHRSAYTLDPPQDQQDHQGPPPNPNPYPTHPRSFQDSDPGQPYLSRMSRFASGPLGDVMLLPSSNEQAGTPSTPTLDSHIQWQGMSDLHALRMMDTIMRQTGPHPNAIVFVQAESTFHYFDDQRSLAGLLGEWHHLPASNPNLALMLFSVGSYDGLLELSNRLPIPEIRYFILRGRDATHSITSLVNVAGPAELELGRLLDYYSHKKGCQLKSEERDTLKKWMAAEDLPASIWIRRMSAASNINLQSAISAGWFSAHDPSLVNPQQRLEELVGLDLVKARIQELVALAAHQLPSARKFYAKSGRSPMVPPRISSPNLHMVFTGNPGTGKTTVARLFGEILHEIGLLRRGHLVEVSGGSLVADHVGGTALKTNRIIDEALDGVLFIDEAYALAAVDRGGYGMEAIETLMTRMEDERHRLVVIIAGYPSRMDQFLRSNPGLRRRFPPDNVICFEDYTASELWQILKSMLRQRGLTCSEALIPKLKSIIRSMVATQDEGFGNAGEIRNLTDALERKFAVKKYQDPSCPVKLTPEEIPLEYRKYLPPPKLDPDQLLFKLDSLVGIDAVKRTFHRMVNRIRLEQLRGNSASPNPIREPLHHLVFTGNPGTGKTTVARLLGEIYHSLGLLRKGHCLEVSRAELVAGYVGQTALKTREVILNALDGILFIDEAYSLSRGGEHDFGQEAIDTLVKAMEQYQDRLLIIVAGYPQEMESFLSRNPGLQSRFSSRVHFDDFTPGQLTEILQCFAHQEGYQLNNDALLALQDAFTNLRIIEGQNFGNGRTARLLFEQMKDHLAERLLDSGTSDPTVDPQAMNLLTAEDLPPEVRAQLWPGINLAHHALSREQNPTQQ